MTSQRFCCSAGTHVPTRGDVLARGKAAARAGRYGSDTAAADFHAGFVGVVRPQERMAVVSTPEPELCVDEHPSLTGGPV